jgi:ribose 5-phosphate isomerase B
MRIALGNDHRGVELKQAIINFLKNLGHDYHDFGSYGTESVDYPDFARPVAEAVSSSKFDYGILICSTGIGMCIAANKVKGIRADLCHSVQDAIRARQHNDANVLCLAGENIELNASLEIVKAFLSATFEGGRHLRRLDKVRAIEAEYLDNR